MQHIHCPNCLSPKVKKNGHTHHSKQNHKCKDCGRQFVLQNNYSIGALIRSLIKRNLKERLSLRAICRVFDISLTWLQAFAQNLWQKTPKDLGITKQMAKGIKKAQIFGLQADEMWSFVGNKKNKKWIWVVYDPTHGLVIAYHIGGRGVAAAKKLWNKIPKNLRQYYFETDHWDAYKKIIPSNLHKTGKDLTYFIEDFNATIRARCSRLVRKGLSFSKSEEWHNKAIDYFFWQFNLERQPYF